MARSGCHRSCFCGVGCGGSSGGGGAVRVQIIVLAVVDGQAAAAHRRSRLQGHRLARRRAAGLPTSHRAHPVHQRRRAGQYNDLPGGLTLVILYALDARKTSSPRASRQSRSTPPCRQHRRPSTSSRRRQRALTWRRRRRVNAPVCSRAIVGQPAEHLAQQLGLDPVARQTAPLSRLPAARRRRSSPAAPRRTRSCACPASRAARPGSAVRAAPPPIRTARQSAPPTCATRSSSSTARPPLPPTSRSRPAACPCSGR